MVMPIHETFPGAIDWGRTPFWVEPLDRISVFDPALQISIMGPAQMGKSMMVLLAAIAYIISEDPKNIIFLTGHTKLSQDAMDRISFVIKQCGLEHYIGPNTVKKKNSKSGDTSMKKDFRGVDLKVGSLTNHNLLRQNTCQIIIGDDTDAAKLSKKDTGSTIKLMGGRVKAAEDRSKQIYNSTPQVRGNSMIETQINKSDKRNWFIQCPICGSDEKRMVLKLPYKVNDHDYAGLTWKLDNLGRVIESSVGYVCQLCAGFFTDKNKREIINSGKWIATKEWLEPYHYGYEINGLVAPHGMTSWYSHAIRYNACNPQGLPRIEADYQTYINIDYGDLYDEPIANQIVASDIMKNCRAYEIGVIPESLSISDGNEDIIWLQLTADCNGVLEDARIDLEIKAYSRSGPSYSVWKQSLGTFIPNQSQEEKSKTVREKWTYRMGCENSVWNLMDVILGQKFRTDTGREMSIGLSGIDAGYLTDYIFAYINKRVGKFKIIGLMGDKEHDFIRSDWNGEKDFQVSKSNSMLYMVNINSVKDDLAERLKLKWDKRNDKKQPHLYVNYPQYDYTSFFSHYESEEKKERMVGKVLKYIWEKKPGTQNHFFDCCVYQIALIDIMLYLLFDKAAKKSQESYGWEHFAALVRKPKVAE
jgi:phage terminase large subunit GpA-like protein